MEELHNNNAGQGAGHVDSAAKPVVSVGKTLREARERLGLSVADVSNQTKIVSRQIEALEADDFQHLPEMPFVRGFVRCYAKLLQLDAQVLLAALPQPAAAVQLMPASVEVPFPRARSQQLQNLLWLAAALLVVVLVLFAVWHYTTPPEQPEVAQVETQVALPAAMQVMPASTVPESSVMAASSVAAEAASSVAAAASSGVAAATPVVQSVPPVVPVAPPVAPAALPAVVAPPAAMPAKPAAQLAQPPVSAAKPAVQTAKTLAQFVQPQLPSAKPIAATSIPPQAAALRLVFDADSWTEIEDKSGKTISSQVNQRGSELRLDGRAPFKLVIGHAPSVRLYYRGKQVDLKPYINAYSEVARVTLE